MKNRAFGLVNMFAFMLMFIILLLTISVIAHKLNLYDPVKGTYNPNTGYSNTYTKKEKKSDDDIDYDYSSVEKSLRNAAAQYQKDYYPGYDKDDALYVTSKKLIALDYLPVLTDGQVSCEGYARITYDNIIEVEPFVKCGKYYKTEGYSSLLAE